MIKNENFNALVENICTQPNLVLLRSVIEKELLHYDILFALSSHGLLDKLTFQGGTALRLCYGLKRFSEDLDFAGGTNFSREDFILVKSVIEDYLGNRYGLEVTVKEPNKASLDQASNKTTIHRWQIAVLTRPEKRDIPKQKIRLEIANIPAHTRKLRPILSNYDFLPDGYTETFIFVESLEEILADKIVALADRAYLKSRDIWDLAWLHQKKQSIEIELIRKKINDYKIENFNILLKNRLDSLEGFINSKPFMDEMTRFLERDTLQRTLLKPGYLEYLNETLIGLGKEVLSKI